jgi:hypothetical protein
MNDVTEYEIMFYEFLDGDISVSEFQSSYLSKFKGEKRVLGESFYGVLEDVFGCVDSFTLDVELLSQNPNFYLNEMQLRAKVRQAVDRLRAIR